MEVDLVSLAVVGFVGFMIVCTSSMFYRCIRGVKAYIKTGDGNYISYMESPSFWKDVNSGKYNRDQCDRKLYEAEVDYLNDI